MPTFYYPDFQITKIFSKIADFQNLNIIPKYGNANRGARQRPLVERKLVEH